MEGAVFAGTEGLCDACSSLEFRLVALPVLERQAVAIKALSAGNGKDGGGVEASGEEDDGARILIRGHGSACGRGG